MKKAETKVGNQDIEISIYFSELPTSIVIDLTLETSLQNEYLLMKKDIWKWKRDIKMVGPQKYLLKRYILPTINVWNSYERRKQI